MKIPIALRAALILTTAAVLVLAASSPVAAQAPRRACFAIGDIESFTSPDSRTVYLRTRAHDVWAFDLAAPCFGIDWRRRPTLRSQTADSICEGGGNVVEIRTQYPRRTRRRCPVSHVRRLSPAEVAALPANARP